MKRVLVTGGTGFVGANLCRRLLAEGHEVHLLVRPEHHTWRIDSIRDDLHLHDADLRDHQAVAKSLNHVRPDWVFNLAAHGAYSWQTDLFEMVNTNFVGTVNLLQAALGPGFEAFVHTGSSSEYGVKDHSPPETEWLEPNSHYAVTKGSATLFCRYTGQSLGMNVCTLRLYSVFGPWEEPGRLMPTLVVRGLRGQLPPLVSPDTARDYVYTEDVLDAYLLAASGGDQEPGAVYNVGTGVQTRLRELVELVRAELGIDDEPKWGSMPPRSWDTEVWIADARLIRERLGWSARHTLADGFRGLVAWIRDAPGIRAHYEQLTP